MHCAMCHLSAVALCNVCSSRVVLERRDVECASGALGSCWSRALKCCAS